MRELFKPRLPIGRKFWIPVASLVALFSVAQEVAYAQADPRVTSLVSQSASALHIDAMHSGEVIHAKGSFVSSGLSGSSDVWNEMGGTREASFFSTPPLGGGTGWDGNQSWTLDQTGLVLVDGGVLGRSSAISQAYVANYALWTPGYGGATVAWDGSKSENGKTYDVLTVTPPKSSLPVEMWFDGTTHLPVKTVQTAGPLVTTTTMTDFRPVAGLMFPYSVTSTGGSISSFTASTVEVNPPDSAAHFNCSKIVTSRFFDSGWRAASVCPDAGHRESRGSRRDAQRQGSVPLRV